MKNTYIIAIETDGMPVVIKQREMTDITYIGKNYRNAYICSSKKEADKIRKDRYNNYAEKKIGIKNFVK